MKSSVGWLVDETCLWVNLVPMKWRVDEVIADEMIVDGMKITR